MKTCVAISVHTKYKYVNIIFTAFLSFDNSFGQSPNGVNKSVQRDSFIFSSHLYKMAGNPPCLDQKNNWIIFEEKEWKMLWRGGE